MPIRKFKSKYKDFKIFLHHIYLRRLRKFLNIIHTGIPHAINEWEKDFQLIEIHGLIKNYLQLGFNKFFNLKV